MATVKKVLIIAPSASEKFGGESILPVHYFRRLPDKGVKASLLVHDRTRNELEQLFPDQLDQLLFIKDTPAHKALFRCSQWLPKKLSRFNIVFGLAIDLLTELAQRKIARKLIREQGFDLVHVPIRVSPKLPSCIHNMGVPVVFGPLNGGMTYPEPFAYLQSKAERYFTTFGRGLSNLANQIIPGKLRATTIVVANERSREALPKTRCRNIVTLVENGVDLPLFSKDQNATIRECERFQFAYLGRLVAWKCVDLLLEAAGRLKANGYSFQLDIIGDGSERVALEQQCNHLGLADRVTFLGFVPQQECPQLLKARDCLVLSSMYECGGAVVLEAMSMGKPVIATDWGGPADYLDETCGILVSPEDSREAVVQRFTASMQRLIEDPDMAMRLGAAGPEKIAREYDWSKKITQMINIYDDSIALYQSRNRVVSSSG